jgi:superfamily II DNA or RNA helicase
MARMDSKVRTYLGERGYTVVKKDLGADQIALLEHDLTFLPNHVEGYGPPPEAFPVYGKSSTKMFIPKFFGIQRFGKPQQNKIEKHIENINVQFKGELRENQIAPVRACLKAAKNKGGGILCLPCGYGKTALAIHLICKLGVKALVVVAKEFLMEQWKERIQQFAPDARIGILRQKKQDVEDKDIVIGMLQSISMCDYDISIYKSFGVVFYDEVHCVPSRVFSRALRRVQTKYHFGLSATPTRADGMTKVTKMYIGPIVYRINKRTAKKNPKNMQVIRVQFKDLPANGSYRERRNYRGKPDVIKMITKLNECPKRIALISAICRFFIEEDKRHILVLSDRIQYLKDIEKQIRFDTDPDGKEEPPFKIGYYIGACKAHERKESESADLILASYAMAKEAMDIPILDTLVMATSKGNAGTIEQCVGRVLRQESFPETRLPLVVDIVDDFSTFANQAWRRRDYFRKAHYPIQDIVFDEKKDTLTDKFAECVENFVAPDMDEEFIVDTNFGNGVDESDKVATTLAPPKPEVADNIMDMILAGATGMPGPF